MAVAIGGAAAGVYSTRFHELPSKVIFIKIRLSYVTIGNVILDHICAKDYNMNCPMFAYVLGRFILRLYTNYLYIIYRDVNISKLIPTHKYHLVIVSIPRILEIYFRQNYNFGM